MNNQEQQQEEWRTTDYYPGYAFSNKGRVYSYRARPNKFLDGNKVNNKYIHVGLTNFNNKQELVYLSRVIYYVFGNNPELLPYKQVDHIKRRETLNNNINNLRLADRKENCSNRGKMKRNYLKRTPSSNYIGVSYTPSNKWESGIKIKNKSFNLGRYKHQENAAYVYNKVASYFKPPNHWSNSLGDDFHLPKNNENREYVIEQKIEKINRWLNS